MKVLIACDMEGISGVTCWDHVDSKHPEYTRFRRIMTGDVNAAIEGAFNGGANEVVVTDGHADGRNLLLEELEPRAKLNAGSPSPFSMVQGINSGVDAALFVGYHARVGTQNAILDHTWSSTRVHNLWLNDRLCGEFGLNSAVCGAFDVPVLMVSGDQSLCAEARDWSPDITTAQVKTAVGRTAATCLPLPVSQGIIRQAAELAVTHFKAGKAPRPIKVETPVRITVEFTTSLMADFAALLPGSIRLDGRRVEYNAMNMPEAFLAFRAAVNLISA